MCLLNTILLPTEPDIIFNNESSNECLTHQRLHDKFSIFAANPQSYLTSDLTAPDLILIIEFLIREVLGPRLVATVFIEEVGCNQLAIDWKLFSFWEQFLLSRHSEVSDKFRPFD